MDMAESILKTVKKHLDHLTWKCGECEKMGECEASELSILGNYERRYCESIIEAAIREELTFQKPFPIDPEMDNAMRKIEEPKLCICCEEITEENAHLHRNCGK